MTDSTTTTDTSPNTDADLISATPAAIKAMQTILSAKGKPGDGLRFSAVTGGCSGLMYDLSIENALGADDRTQEIEGITVYLDKKSLLFLRGTTIDYVTSLNGAQFEFGNPNAKSACGCGKSFEAAT